MNCELCGFRLKSDAYEWNIKWVEFRDDGIPFVSFKAGCEECSWWNVIVEYYGRTIWRFVWGSRGRAKR